MKSLSCDLEQKLWLEAQKSDIHRKYAAVIMYRNKIISFGFNCHSQFSDSCSQCVLRAL